MLIKYALELLTISKQTIANKYLIIKLICAAREKEKRKQSTTKKTNLFLNL